MHWEDERYVRLYTRDTPTWLLMPWQARATLPLILRKADRAGVIDLGSEGMEGLAITIGLPLEVTKPGVEALAKKGTITLTDTTLVVDKFVEAQETPQSDSQRQRTSREKRRDLAKSLSRGVTRSHAVSQPVTPNLAVPNRAEPAEPKETTPLLSRLVASFLAVLGREYAGNAHDMSSVDALRKLGSADEIDRRWRASLTAKYPRCATLKELVKHWNHFAATGPPNGAAGRRVGSEQVDWTGQRNEVSNDF